MKCEYEERGKIHVCIRCGNIQPYNVLRNCDGKPLLGDKIKRITNALGIKTCGGCEKRRKALNKRFKRK